MTIPAQAAVWDDSRNSSAIRPPSPNALPECLASFVALRESQPALCQWLADGFPTLTEAQHVERFGEPYRATPRRRARA